MIYNNSVLFKEFFKTPNISTRKMWHFMESYFLVPPYHKCILTFRPTTHNIQLPRLCYRRRLNRQPPYTPQCLDSMLTKVGTCPYFCTLDMNGMCKSIFLFYYDHLFIFDPPRFGKLDSPATRRAAPEKTVPEYAEIISNIGLILHSLLDCSSNQRFFSITSIQHWLA